MCRIPKIDVNMIKNFSEALHGFERKIKKEYRGRSNIVTMDTRKRKNKKHGFNRNFSKFNLTVGKKDISDFFGVNINVGSYISTVAILTIGLKEIYFSVSSSGNRIPITKYNLDLTSDGSTIFISHNDILEAILYKNNIPYEIGKSPSRSNMSHVEYIINKLAGVYVFSFEAPMSILVDNNKNMVVSHDKFIKSLDDIRIFNNNYDVANTIGKYLRFVENITYRKDGYYYIDVLQQDFFKERTHIRGKIQYPVKNGFIDDSMDVPVLSTLIEYYRYSVDEDDFRHFMNVIDKGILLEITHIEKAKMHDTYLSSGLCITKDSKKEIPVSSDVKDLIITNSDYGVTIFSPSNRNYYWNMNGLVHKIDVVYGDNLSAVLWYKDIEGVLQRIRVNETEFMQYNIYTTSEIESVIDSTYMSMAMKKKNIDLKVQELDMKGNEITHQILKMSHDEDMFKMKMISEKEKNEFLIYSLELKLKELERNHLISGVKQASTAIASITTLITTLKSLIL